MASADVPEKAKSYQIRAYRLEPYVSSPSPLQTPIMEDIWIEDAIEPVTRSMYQRAEWKSVSELFTVGALIHSFDVTLMRGGVSEARYEIFYSSKGGEPSRWEHEDHAWKHYDGYEWNQAAWVVAKNVEWELGGRLYRQMVKCDLETQQLLAVQSE